MKKGVDKLEYIGYDVKTMGDQQSIESKYEESLRLQEKTRELLKKWQPVLEGLRDE